MVIVTNINTTKLVSILDTLKDTTVTYINTANTTDEDVALQMYKEAVDHAADLIITDSKNIGTLLQDDGIPVLLSVS